MEAGWINVVCITTCEHPIFGNHCRYAGGALLFDRLCSIIDRYMRWVHVLGFHTRQCWVNIDSHMNFLLNQGMNPRYWFFTEPHCSTSHSKLMKFIFSNHRLQRVKWSKRVKITWWSLACGQAVWKGDLRFLLSTNRLWYSKRLNLI